MCTYNYKTKELNYKIILKAIVSFQVKTFSRNNTFLKEQQINIHVNQIKFRVTLSAGFMILNALNGYNFKGSKPIKLLFQWIVVAHQTYSHDYTIIVNTNY